MMRFSSINPYTPMNTTKMLTAHMHATIIKEGPCDSSRKIGKFLKANNLLMYEFKTIKTAILL